MPTQAKHIPKIFFIFGLCSFLNINANIVIKIKDTGDIKWANVADWLDK